MRRQGWFRLVAATAGVVGLGAALAGTASGAGNVSVSAIEGGLSVIDQGSSNDLLEIRTDREGGDLVFEVQNKPGIQAFEGCENRSDTLAICPTRLDGEPVDDLVILPGFGNDRVSFGDGAIGRLLNTVLISGGDGNDTFKGSPIADNISGDDGKDTLLGLDGKDFLGGGKGNDLLKGGDGADSLFGDKGDDECLGGEGKDDFKKCEEKEQ